MHNSNQMGAMVFRKTGEPLDYEELPRPVPKPHQLLIDIEACGVCRTDLHIVDGELKTPKLPLIPGHEIVGRVKAVGEAIGGFHVGERVGVPWLGGACERCSYCDAGHENLCDSALFTGYTLNGGYAEFCVAEAAFCFKLDQSADATWQAPLLCAGFIGHRCLRLTGDPRRIGIYGFGAAGHIVAQFAKAEGREVFAYTRPGDSAAQKLALDMGSTWVGGSDEKAPELLDAAIIFAPVGALVPAALAAVGKGGIVVCGGIHMSAIPSFDYDLLWGERVLRSVANLRHRDGLDCLVTANKIKLDIRTKTFSLRQANEALSALRTGNISGAAVLVP